MKSNSTKRFTAVLVLAVLTMGLAGCPKDKAVAASSAIQKYAHTLDAFQQGEIKAYGNGFVSAPLHREFQGDFSKAASAGQDLDKGILAVSQGGSPQVYIDAAYASSDALIADLNLIPDSKKRLELQVLFKASRDVLDNSLQLFLK